MAVTFRITDAGWAAWLAAEAGAASITISHVAFGDNGHAIDDEATALVNERARVGAAGGQSIGPQQIHLTAIEDSALDYAIREIGLFLSTGELFAQWSDVSEVAGNKSASLPYVLTIDLALDDIADGGVTIEETEISFPPATTEISGRIEIATEAEVLTGTDAVRAVTPATLAARTATDERAGLVELASNTETQTGADNARAVTPASLASLTATLTRRGLVELATEAEVLTGTDTNRAVTPQGLAALTATDGRRGLIELATQTEVNTGTDADRAVTPATLAARLSTITVPTASTTTPGVIEIATQTEVNTGTDTERAITPATLAVRLDALELGDIGTGELLDEAVTLPKIQHINTARVMGRITAGTGDVELLTAANLRTLINVEDGATADQTGAEIKAAYEGEADTNALTDARAAKIDHLTVTTATDLDALRTRVAELDAAVVLQGDWDASSGSFPGSGAAQAGWSWIVSVGGTVDSVEFSVGDRIVALDDNASATTYAANWLKLDYTDRVSSVAGRTGNVVISTADISGLGTISTQNANAVDISGVFGTLDGGGSGSITGAGSITGNSIYGRSIISTSGNAAFDTVASLVAEDVMDSRSYSSAGAGVVIHDAGNPYEPFMVLDLETLRWFDGAGTELYRLGPGAAGSFTPGNGSGGGSVTWVDQRGRHQIIGNRVHISLRLSWTASSGTPSMIINGLPAAPALDKEGLTISYRGSRGHTGSPNYYEEVLRAYTDLATGTIVVRGCTPTGVDGAHKFYNEDAEVMISGSYEIDLSAL